MREERMKEAGKVNGAQVKRTKRSTDKKTNRDE
jgi:hypothetical protein